jgi:outer membrane protein OmpA-like peptidoglycan-associated protein
MIARWFWAVLAALAVIAIGVIFWQTGNRTTVVPPVAQSPPVASAAPKVEQAPASDAAAPTVEKEPAAAPSATTAAQAPSTNAAAPMAEKEPAAPPSATTGAQTPSTNAAAPTAEKEPAPAAPTVTHVPASDAPTVEKEPAMAAPMVMRTPTTNATPKARENEPATKPDEATSEPNAKATAELTSWKPGSSMKDLVAALNGSVINFGSGSAELPASGATFLQHAAADLKQMPAGYRLEIAGYTDNTGAAAVNVALSQRRADAVREALVKSGANADVLVAKGYGSADPIASNDTPDGRLRNRRIEYRLLNTPDRH